MAPPAFAADGQYAGRGSSEAAGLSPAFGRAISFVLRDGRFAFAGLDAPASVAARAGSIAGLYRSDNSALRRKPARAASAVEAVRPSGRKSRAPKASNRARHASTSNAGSLFRLDIAAGRLASFGHLSLPHTKRRPKGRRSRRVR
jgi:hypothetical protein